MVWFLVDDNVTFHKKVNLRYPPWGSFDVPENMIAVCHQCHCEIHGKAD
jgi:hypothetical protein